MKPASDEDNGKSRPGGPIRDLVVDELRREITRGALQPGERLTEWNVASRLGVSRGPVREGLRELEREGLILTYPYRGAVVMGMSDDELLGLLLPIRLTIERFATAAAFSKFTDETIEELEAILVDMRQAADAKDTDRLTETDLAFHRCMIEAGGHGHALQLWESIHPRIQAQLHRIGRFRSGSLDRIPGEHQLLLDVFRARDEEQLSDALEQHILHDARRFMPHGDGSGSTEAADSD
jgi:DNA-binding GntR family transcriptional regulator